MTTVLVVDDEAPMRHLLCTNLRARGFDVVACSDAVGALDAAAAVVPDVVLLDVGLPDLDGAEVVHGLRGWTDVPILVVSAIHDEGRKVAMLDAGADDYVTKPFSTAELMARVRAAVRPSPRRPGLPVIRTDDFTVDLSRHEVVRVDGAVHLTRIEWALLAALAAAPGRLVTQRDLLSTIWGIDDPHMGHYVRFHVAGLRRKLEPDPGDPRYVVTVRGLGVLLDVQGGGGA